MDPGLPFRGAWSVQFSKGDKKTIGFDVHIAPEAALVGGSDNHLNVDIAAIARAKDSSLAGQFNQKIDRILPPDALKTIAERGIEYKNTLELPAGVYVVRVVVRDNNTGRMGSSTTFVKVE